MPKPSLLICFSARPGGGEEPSTSLFERWSYSASVIGGTIRSRASTNFGKSPVTTCTRDVLINTEVVVDDLVAHAVLGVAHRDADGRAVLDCLIDQGQRPPFDPNKAVDRFVRVLRDYRILRVVGDRYAGNTFRSQFVEQGVAYDVAARTASELYEALEPRLNSHQVVLLDVPTLNGLIQPMGPITGPVEHFASNAVSQDAARRSKKSAS